MKKESNNFLKLISSSDLKKFNKWIKNNKVFFNNNSFYTNLLNINSKKIYKESFFEFLIYNNIVIKNKYSFFDDFYKFEKNFWNDKIENIIFKLIKLFDENKVLSSKEFSSFLINLFSFSEKNSDFSEEKKLLENYWKFSDFLFKNNIKNFNKWIIYINKHIYKKQLGFRI